MAISRRHPVATVLIGAPIGLLFLYVSFLVFVVGPTDVTPANCRQIHGEVKAIGEAGTNDVTIELTDHSAYFYINRGLERGLDLGDLRTHLLGQQIQLWHAKSWPLRGGHVVQLQVGDDIIYSEW